MIVNINKVPYDAGKTFSINNIGLRNPMYLSDADHFDIPKQYRKLWPYPEYPSKRIYKVVFGKQLTCVSYSYRNWVWTFSDSEDKACLNVLCSESGTHMEFRLGSRQTIVKELIDHVTHKIMTFQDMTYD